MKFARIFSDFLENRCNHSKFLDFNFQFDSIMIIPEIHLIFDSIFESNFDLMLFIFLDRIFTEVPPPQILKRSYFLVAGGGGLRNEQEEKTLRLAFSISWWTSWHCRQFVHQEDERVNWNLPKLKRTPWHEKKVQSTFRARAIRGRRNSAEVVFMPRKKNFCTKRQMKNFPRSLLRGCADRSSFSSWESRIPSTQPRVSSWMPSPRGIHLSPGDKVCLIEWCSSPAGGTQPARPAGRSACRAGELGEN